MKHIVDGMVANLLHNDSNNLDLNNSLVVYPQFVFTKIPRRCAGIQPRIATAETGFYRAKKRCFPQPRLLTQPSGLEKTRTREFRQTGRCDEISIQLCQAACA